MYTATKGAVVAMVLCITPSGLAAQTVGDRLRVSIPGDTVVGMVSRVDDRGFDLVESGSVRSLTYDQVQLIERSQGVHGQKKRFAIYGGAVGAAIGMVMGYRHEVCSGDPIQQIFFRSEVTCKTGQIGPTVGLGLLGGLQGAGAGALVGWLFFKREVWTAIPLPERGASIAPILGYRTVGNGHRALVVGVRIARAR